MALSETDAYTYIQSLFQRGLVIIVGSGASCAHGLPSMPALAAHLCTKVSTQSAELCDAGRAAWQTIAARLEAGEGLEFALGPNPLPESLANIIIGIVSEAIRESEKEAISAILENDDYSSLGRLLLHALKVSSVVDVITTNYDRLVEVHAARAKIRLDTMFYGHTVGRLNETLSREELLKSRLSNAKSRRPKIEYHPHVRLSKPHGSLDWYKVGDECFRCELPTGGAQQIIAPGFAKYRRGYEIPFDLQRTRANNAIDRASALLFIGYGFNDDHLQTHVRPRITEVPTVVMGMELSPSALEHLQLNPNAIGLEDNQSEGCRIVQGNESIDTAARIWTIDGLVKEVIKP